MFATSPKFQMETTVVYHCLECQKWFLEFPISLPVADLVHADIGLLLSWLFAQGYLTGKIMRSVEK
jgi:hypothetical protein